MRVMIPTTLAAQAFPKALLSQATHTVIPSFPTSAFTALILVSHTEISTH